MKKGRHTERRKIKNHEKSNRPGGPISFVLLSLFFFLNCLSSFFILAKFLVQQKKKYPLGTRRRSIKNPPSPRTQREKKKVKRQGRTIPDVGGRRSKSDLTNIKGNYEMANIDFFGCFLRFAFQPSNHHFRFLTVVFIKNFWGQWGCCHHG